MIKLAGFAALFFVTACLYASVGFGGGSTYTALLVASGTDYSLIPIIALTCNIVVVSGNTLRYSHEKIIPWAKLWPILLTSVPMAWVGGRLPIEETLFIGLLAAALFYSGIRLLFITAQVQPRKTMSLSFFKSALIGSTIGLYSGLVGIGGGIFLAPILYALNWGRAKTIAAACSVFILLNSIAGFGGQYMKLSDSNKMMEALHYWPLIPAVLIGGLIGNYIGVKRIPQIWVKRATGCLILVVALRLTLELLN